MLLNIAAFKHLKFMIIFHKLKISYICGSYDKPLRPPLISDGSRGLLPCKLCGRAMLEFGSPQIQPSMLSLSLEHEDSLRHTSLSFLEKDRLQTQYMHSYFLASQQGYGKWMWIQFSHTQSRNEKQCIFLGISFNLLGPAWELEVADLCRTGWVLPSFTFSKLNS